MTINPYGVGLRIGTEVDIVLTNKNSEWVDAKELLPQDRLKCERFAGNDGREHNSSFTRVFNHMARIVSADSYCRAYSTDNLWWTLKSLVGFLKKQAFISYVPSYITEKGTEFVAGGCLKFSIANRGIYSQGANAQLIQMTHQTNATHSRLLKNFDITIGLLSVLFDRRPSAEAYRKEHAIGGDKYTRQSTRHLVYKIPTNFWIYSPSLCHMMQGAARMAYFITLNNLDEKIWKQKTKHKHVIKAINESDYALAQEIWDRTKKRYSKIGHASHDNPFTPQLVKTIDFLLEYGIGTLGPGVYKNWRMKRRKNHYHGHLSDLPSWESGVKHKIFKKSHPLYKEWAEKCGIKE
jgi:hypothetical protein